MLQRSGGGGTETMIAVRNEHPETISMWCGYTGNRGKLSVNNYEVNGDDAVFVILVIRRFIIIIYPCSVTESAARETRRNEHASSRTCHCGVQSPVSAHQRSR
mmetsp:Transcript_16860/g.34128  ORF Transcript_16860/g.34128 Transcript_16860/m.34128 type:complete len:103 (-) Transcript_16860:546-854(-)